jgi:uncharacterized phosphosugar-binding protein
VTLYDDYFDEAARRLAALRELSAASINDAADLLVRAHLDGRRVFVFGSGHSALLALDVCVRAGTLATFNPVVVPGLLPSDYPYLRGTLLERVSGIAGPVLDTTGVSADDCLIVISNSGRNAVPVEMAIEARARGLSVIAVTGLETATAEPSRHASGHRLHELADVVIDTHTPYGDAALTVDRFAAALGPLSTVLGSLALHALSVSVAEKLLAAGQVPPVLASGNITGSGSHNVDVLNRHRDQITYLPPR